MVRIIYILFFVLFLSSNVRADLISYSFIEDKGAKPTGYVGNQKIKLLFNMRSGGGVRYLHWKPCLTLVLPGFCDYSYTIFDLKNSCILNHLSHSICTRYSSSNVDIPIEINDIADNEKIKYRLDIKVQLFKYKKEKNKFNPYYAASHHYGPGMGYIEDKNYRLIDINGQKYTSTHEIMLHREKNKCTIYLDNNRLYSGSLYFYDEKNKPRKILGFEMDRIKRFF